MFRVRLALTSSLVAVTACATTDPAPVEYRGAAVGEQGEQGDEAGIASPQAPAKAAGPFDWLVGAEQAPPPLPKAPSSDGEGALESSSSEPADLMAPPNVVVGPNPDWAARAGPSFADFALRPEELRPFDPKSPPETHEVQPGDTVAKLSVLYQAPARQIIQLNRLPPPFSLTPGSTLRVPRPKIHVVRSGETLLTLARAYRVDARSLALLNQLQPPYRLDIGDRVLLPVGARSAPAAPQAPLAAGEQAGRFAWPLRGQIIGRFGPGENGRRLDGVDIAAEEGAPFQASAAGRVVYAGDDLEGYGKVVLIQHANGWVTAYARAGALDVVEGDQVRRGQTLGRIGRFGSGPTRLHFQVRQGRTARDPAQLLAQN